MSATAGSSSCNSFRTFLQFLICRFKSQSCNVLSNHGSSSGSTVSELERHLIMINGNSSTGSPTWPRKVYANLAKDDQVVHPIPNRKSNFRPCTKWVLGSILFLFLPFWKQKWEKFKRIEAEAEIVVEEVKNVATVVEKVATTTEKVSGEVAEKLPENSKLQKTAKLVEHLSEVAAHDAHLTTDFIHEVEELKQDLDDLETMVETVIEGKSGEK